MSPSGPGLRLSKRALAVACAAALFLAVLWGLGRLAPAGGLSGPKRFAARLWRRRGPVYSGPIVDSHAHVHPGTAGERDAYIDELAAAMARAGVTQALLGLNAKHRRHLRLGPVFDASHDGWVAAACERHPGRFIPSLGGFDPGLASSVDYVGRKLDSGPWKAVGELDLRNRRKRLRVPADAPSMMRIYRLAARHRIPVSVHYNFDFWTAAESGRAELERAVAANPDVAFITAHQVDLALMRRHSNVWGEYIAQPHGTGMLSLGDALKLDKALIDRIVVGTDAQNPGLVSRGYVWGSDQRADPVRYEERVARTREDLGALPPDAAEKVAFKNLLGLLKRARTGPRRSR